jgi:hypothetical protein
VSRTEREHRRYAHEAVIKIRIGNRLLEGRTRNVSRGGLCATLTDPLPLGSDVELELVLVFDDELQSDALKVAARVVWCTELDDGNQIGVAFRPVQGRRVAQLELFITSLQEQRDDAPRVRPTVDERFR